MKFLVLFLARLKRTKCVRFGVLYDRKSLDGDDSVEAVSFSSSLPNYRAVCFSVYLFTVMSSLLMILALSCLLLLLHFSFASHTILLFSLALPVRPPSPLLLSVYLPTRLVFYLITRLHVYNKTSTELTDRQSVLRSCIFHSPLNCLNLSFSFSLSLISAP